MPVLLTDHRGPITLLTLNRPERRNALSAELADVLTTAFEFLELKKECRAIVINGVGDGFCAGLDLKEAQDASEQEQIDSARRIAKLLSTIHRSSKVTIAAIHGAVRAGGGGVVAACDLAIAASDATLGFPEVRRGLVPALVSALLRRQLSERAMRELFILAEPVDADRALQMGLINRVIGSAGSGPVTAAAIELATTAINGAPGAIALTKRLLDELQPRLFDDDLEHAIRFHENARASDEAAEGIAAFVERRAPKW